MDKEIFIPCAKVRKDNGYVGGVENILEFSKLLWETLRGFPQIASAST